MAVPETRSIAEFSVVQGGLQVTHARKDLSVEVPYLRVANVFRDRLDLRDIKYMRVTEVELGRASLLSGDILVVEGHGNPDEVGRSAVWTGEIKPCVHQNHLILVRVDASRAIPKYVSAYLNSSVGRQQLIRAGKTTSGLNTININNVRAVQVPLLPLPEQERIAAILDKVDAIRRKRKEAIDLTEELLRATFLDMFGDPVTNPKEWPLRQLGETFSEDPRIGTLVPAGPTGEHVIVRVGELGDYDVALERCKRATLSASELDRFQLLPGDIVLARAIGSENHLGKASVLQQVAEAVAFDSHVMRLRFAPSMLRPYFFLQWLRTPGGRARFMREAGRTAVQFNVNGQQIARVAIPLPPIEAQDRFARFFGRTRVMMKKLSTAWKDSDALFASLVHRAFRGEL